MVCESFRAGKWNQASQNVGSAWWAKEMLAPLKRAVTAQCSPVLWVSAGTESSGVGLRTVQAYGKIPGLKGF